LHLFSEKKLQKLKVNEKVSQDFYWPLFLQAKELTHRESIHQYCASKNK